MAAYNSGCMDKPPDSRPERSTWTAEAASDRLSSATFLAALLHGVVILGVTFGVQQSTDKDPRSSLEVVLVTSEYQDRPAPRSAVLLAQQNLSGAGNAPPDATLETALGHTLAADALGAVQDGSEVNAEQGAEELQAATVVTSRNGRRLVAEPGTAATRNQEQRSTLPLPAKPIELLGRIADTTVVPDAQPRDTVISANTRESRIASYLSVWKRRVEEVGTLNFPGVAPRGSTQRFPVLEVAIQANGNLKDVVLVRSSGDRQLDRAAMEILRLAAPFQAFPPNLRTDYDVLRFAYEWRFSSGGSVRMAAGT
jgi:periplasmic protein TonB